MKKEEPPTPSTRGLRSSAVSYGAVVWMTRGVRSHMVVTVQHRTVLQRILTLNKVMMPVGAAIVM